ncbi:MAG: hypothetical protein HC857_15910 [Synechococcales cyanobacterium RU_4_20]|nr:hypothetical protein [Synechococcales cyanobacterium RU_4_20]
MSRNVNRNIYFCPTLLAAIAASAATGWAAPSVAQDLENGLSLGSPLERVHREQPQSEQIQPNPVQPEQNRPEQNRPELSEVSAESVQNRFASLGGPNLPEAISEKTLLPKRVRFLQAPLQPSPFRAIQFQASQFQASQF